MLQECPVIHGPTTLKDIQSLQERVRGISGIARNIRQGTFDYTDHDQLLAGIATQDEAKVAWFDTGKDVRNAIIAVLSDEVVSDIIARKSNRGPYGLIRLKTEREHALTEEASSDDPGYRVVTTIPEEDPFTFVNESLHDTLTESLGRTIERLDYDAADGKTSPLVEAYKRYDRWVDIANTQFENPIGRIELIDGGVGNATQIMSKLCEAIPVLTRRHYKGNSTPATNAIVGYNSEKFLINLASLDLPSFLTLRNFLRLPLNNAYLTASVLTLHENEKGPHVGIREKILKEAYEAVVKKSNLLSATVRTNCPAIVMFDGAPNAIRSLWQWNVDIARTVWERDER